MFTFDTNKNIKQGTILANPAAPAIRYENALRELVDRLTAETNDKLSALFKTPLGLQYFAMDESFPAAVKRVLDDLSTTFSQLFTSAAPKVATNAVDDINNASSVAVNKSVSNLTGNLSIKSTMSDLGFNDFLKAQVTANTNLIKSIPTEYLNQVSKSVFNGLSTGSSAGDIFDSVKKYDGMTKERAKFIAENETRKTYNQLNAQRCKKSGIKKFKWRHSAGGMHPRQLHLELNGQIFSYGDLPVIDDRTDERGLPGQLPNCHCVQIPVFDFNA